MAWERTERAHSKELPPCSIAPWKLKLRHPFLRNILTWTQNIVNLKNVHIIWTVLLFLGTKCHNLKREIVLHAKTCISTSGSQPSLYFRITWGVSKTTGAWASTQILGWSQRAAAGDWDLFWYCVFSQSSWGWSEETQTRNQKEKPIWASLPLFPYLPLSLPLHVFVSLKPVSCMSLVFSLLALWHSGSQNGAPKSTSMWLISVVHVPTDWLCLSRTAIYGWAAWAHKGTLPRGWVASEIQCDSLTNISLAKGRPMNKFQRVQGHVFLPWVHKEEIPEYLVTGRKFITWYKFKLYKVLYNENKFLYQSVLPFNCCIIFHLIHLNYGSLLLSYDAKHSIVWLYHDLLILSATLSR